MPQEGKALFDIAKEKPNHVKLTDEQRELLSIIIVLQNAGMCHKELECSKCRRTMTTLWLSCESRFAFNCSKCNKNKSPFEKTFLQGRKMELRKFLQLLWMISWRQYCQNVIASVWSGRENGFAMGDLDQGSLSDLQ